LANVPAAAIAPFHERSFKKVEFCKLNYGKGCDILAEKYTERMARHADREPVCARRPLHNRRGDNFVRS
jgi:hypothetical protein